MFKGLEPHNLDQVLELVAVWKNAFLKSPEYFNLSEDAQDESGPVILGFGEYMFSYRSLSPAEWAPDAAQECCLEDFPAHMIAEPNFFESVSPVLVAFFEFLGRERQYLQAKDLSERVSGLKDEITRLSEDPARWSKEKLLIMQATLDGHDLNDLDILVDYARSYEEQFHDLVF
ncbi:hypothetical protein COW36_16495 [bacterium (Candidatus Blackallbacteria) CG17_big_fil_post_rev_8_21_14_2_50_48_46]|uniref:Uncharacterized protein n=1 Tax=bacterium (Candidatus Blackallbacteria) CG17_big_fil_post_rev_8_21_14_2_50_48_46 TaxID=2014261 RepID=A0A2M7G1X5_9BACT|nr:MAG: hypothetical protein COW64_06945 [bacterium (Candidatus Blackallbacteria) CG18_big_fil_WC_8_21_14_2_50_49_26]PIW15636.1 MAG: hypothetical protein COW36_16495 [bacterium (Candidatus Blackallbacteria) CG17_big_fil_post_rev_8_21_14_2_50_48_46]PIW48120.1 MAG: hypothetical protein COW20_10650 [bacterium (Candidatus Blackallbacteria) CG13_big_fil_rev_8_21_14_2_50_49_14]